MDATLINPFIETTLNVIKTMAQVDVTQAKPYIKHDKLTWGTVTGIIGMAGPQIGGNMVVSFETSCILDIVNKMLMESFTEVSPDVIDAVGELTNMIAGGTKAKLRELGYQFEMSTPMMLTGKQIEMSQLSKVPIVVVPFDTAMGRFVVEANLAPVGATK